MTMTRLKISIIGAIGIAGVAIPLVLECSERFGGSFPGTGRPLLRLGVFHRAPFGELRFAPCAGCGTDRIHGPGAQRSRAFQGDAEAFNPTDWDVTNFLRLWGLKGQAAKALAARWPVTGAGVTVKEMSFP